MVALAIFSFVAVVTVTLPAFVSAANTTYYVDPAGNDSDNGTSPATAWKSLGKVNGSNFGPGDKILFKRGGVWHGSLRIDTAGAAGNPVYYGSYGTGAKPTIHGDGNVMAPIDIEANYITVEGFSVTNFDGANIFDGAEGNRSGIFLGSGAKTNIKVIGNEAYYIEGFSNKPATTAGGGLPRGSTINGNIYQTTGIGNVFGLSTDNLTIEGNYVHDSTATGMNVHGKTNLLVQSNSIYNVGGDGMVIYDATNPLVQFNSVIKANNNSGNSPRGPGVIGYHGTSAIGLWFYSVTGGVAQYNYVEATERPIYDGQAFDFDFFARNSVFQYNYSRDNVGGFMLDARAGGEGAARGNIARYNISVNDGSRQGNGEGFFNGHINNYNNVFYRTDGKGYLVTGDGTFTNNIFYTTGNTTYGGTGRTFTNNAFFGHTPSNPGSGAVIGGDPKFVNPSTSFKLAPGQPFTKDQFWALFDGFKIEAGSPLIDKGVTIANNGGQDFWGNPLYNGAPDIGAHEYKVTDPNAPSLTLSVNPPSLTAGDSATITWTSKNITSCTASDGWTGTKATAGTESVSPTQTTTYTLSCTGPKGNDSRSVTVTVGTNGGGGTPECSDGKDNDGDGATDYPADTGCTDASDVSEFSAPVINLPPTVTLTANPNSTAANRPVILTWSSSNTTACTGTGFTPDAVSGSTAVSPAKETTYSITCTGPGGSATDSVKVTTVVDDTPPTAPTNLKATLDGPAVSLKWNESTDAGLQCKSTATNVPTSETNTNITLFAHIGNLLDGGVNATASVVQAVISLLGDVMNFVLPAAHAANTTYYVDPAGNDGANGTSPTTAWKSLGKVNGTNFGPGDKILFKRGGVWHGSLSVRSQGAAGNPVYYGAYGTGAKPTIHGDGNVLATIAIQNSASHSVVEGFGVTNFDGANIFDGAEGHRNGIMIGTYGGSLDDIKILRNEIYYVEGFSNSAPGGGHGGTARGTNLSPVAPDYANNWSTGGIFSKGVEANNLTIDGNYVHDLTANAISVYGGTKTLVQNNATYNTGTAAIIVFSATNPLVQFNSVVKYNNNSGDSPRGTGVLGYHGIPGHAIMWYGVDGGIAQYNYAEKGHKIIWDAQAWDFDFFTTNSVFQYNYSTENEGGFTLAPGPKGRNNVTRYNLSVNDGSRQGDGEGFFNDDTDHYNNVFYRTDGQGYLMQGGTGIWKNNVFYTTGKNNLTYQATDRTFTNNAFFGHTPSNPGSGAVIGGDPKFVNPSTSFKLAPGQPFTKDQFWALFDGFKIEAGSPLIDKGVTIANNGGQDFWGNPLYNGAPDIGAHEYKVTDPNAPSLTLSVNPPSLTAGDSATITWTSKNITSCTASDGWTGTKATAGTESVSPTQTTTYTLSCTGPKGNDSRSVTVTVGTNGGGGGGGGLGDGGGGGGTLPPLPTSCPKTGVLGYNVYRCTVADGATDCTPTKKIGVSTRGNFLDSNVADGQTYVYLVKAYDYANNESDPSNTDSITIKTKGTLKFSADPTNIGVGDPKTTTLSWTIDGDTFTQCNASGHEKWSGNVNHNAGTWTKTINGLTNTTIFSLICTGTSGTSVSKQVTVTVGDNLPIDRDPLCASPSTPGSGVCQSQNACSGSGGAIKSPTRDCAPTDAVPDRACCVTKLTGNAPVITLTANPDTVAGSGEITTVSWNVTKAKLCTASSCQNTADAVTGVTTCKPNQVWAGDITRMNGSTTFLEPVLPGMVLTLSCVSKDDVTSTSSVRILRIQGGPKQPDLVKGEAQKVDGQENALVPCGTESLTLYDVTDARRIANNCQFLDFITLFKNVMDFLLFVLAMPLAALLFCYAGFLYLTAQGDEGKVKQAHQIFFYVVIGFAIALAGWLIVKAIVTGLGVAAPVTRFLGG